MEAPSKPETQSILNSESIKHQSIKKLQKILFGYAVFLLACGLLGYAFSGFAAKAKSSIIMGAVSAAFIAFAAFLTKSTSDKITRMQKIGIHMGLILPVIFGGVFVWRASNNVSKPEKAYLFMLLVVMATGSVLAFVMLLKAKPKKD